MNGWLLLGLALLWLGLVLLTLRVFALGKAVDRQTERLAAIQPLDERLYR